MDKQIACTCYHPLFVFNQFGNLERSALRPDRHCQRKILNTCGGRGSAWIDPENRGISMAAKCQFDVRAK